MSLRRAGGRPLAVAILAAVAVLASAAPALADHWSGPFRLAGPMSLDLTPAQLAFGPAGAAGVGFAVQDEDNPADAQAYSVVRSPQGRIGPVQPLASDQQILDVAYDGSTLKLLSAGAVTGKTCCTSAEVTSIAPSGRRTQTWFAAPIVNVPLGSLLVLPNHVTLAVMAGANGLWVAQSLGGGGPLRVGRRLTPASDQVNAFDATVLPGGRSLVAWTANNGPAAPAPRGIMTARGTVRSAPRTAQRVLLVAAGHEVDEVQVAGGSAAGTLAYVESWFDSAGAFHSRVVVADLQAPIHPRSFAIAGRQAAGLTLASDARGDQVLSWSACDADGACRVETVGRPAGRRFGAPVSLGAVDAAQAPAAAIAPTGEAVVGWVSAGHVFAAEQPRPGARFARVHQVAATDYASDLTLGFAPRGGAMAVWTQGTLNSSLMAATLR